uniref:Uncharacterized protein n=1 Tax=Anopheles melas TaxID=34690 RepID=A0A182U7W0_9DIPT
MDRQRCNAPPGSSGRPTDDTKRRKLSPGRNVPAEQGRSSDEDDEDSNAALSTHHYREEKILSVTAHSGTHISPARRPKPGPAFTSTPRAGGEEKGSPGGSEARSNSPAWYSAYRSQMVHRMMDGKRQYNSSLNEYDIHILEKRGKR